VLERLGSERALRTSIAVFALLVAAAIGLAAYALVTGLAVQRDTRNITRRVTIIERPTKAQIDARLRAAAAEISPTASRLLLNRLLQFATPAQRAELRGNRGQRGPRGRRGPRGIQGVQGAVGPRGRAVRGPRGPQGPQGPTGPTGAQGPQGAQGVQGVAGDVTGVVADLCARAPLLARLLCGG
jgi:hypothetical protein